MLLHVLQHIYMRMYLHIWQANMGLVCSNATLGFLGLDTLALPEIAAGLYLAGLVCKGCAVPKLPTLLTTDTVLHLEVLQAMFAIHPLRTHQ